MVQKEEVFKILSQARPEIKAYFWRIKACLFPFGWVIFRAASTLT